MQKEQIVQAIHTATTEVFSTMLSIELEVCPWHVETVAPRPSDGVMSFVGVAGPWVGSGVISCSSALACRLCSVFLMMEATEVDAEVLDAIGEIANMVVGSFKTTAESIVGPLSLSIPTTVYGKSFTSKSLGNSEWLVFPFKDGDDLFEVKIWFAPAPEASAARNTANEVLQAV